MTRTIHVNVGSDAGRVGSYGETVYAGAKGGIIAFTKSLAREVTRTQVRVNRVCPGPTDTPLSSRPPAPRRSAWAATRRRCIFGQVKMAADGLASFVNSEEAAEGRTAFLEKRTPDFARFR